MTSIDVNFGKFRIIFKIQRRRTLKYNDPLSMQYLELIAKIFSVNFTSNLLFWIFSIGFFKHFLLT